jgi:hypothetical protein
MKRLAKSSSWQGFRGVGNDGAVEKEVDDAGFKPHNLTSSLQMNTTLHRQAASSTE